MSAFERKVHLVLSGWVWFWLSLFAEFLCLYGPMHLYKTGASPWVFLAYLLTIPGAIVISLGWYRDTLDRLNRYKEIV